MGEKRGKSRPDQKPSSAKKPTVEAAASAESAASQAASQGQQETAKSKERKGQEKQKKQAAKQKASQEKEGKKPELGKNGTGTIPEETKSSSEAEAQAPEDMEAELGGAAVNGTEAGAKAPKSPEEDPGFQKAKALIKKEAEKHKKHEAAGQKASRAQAAAESPGSELEVKAQVQNSNEPEFLGNLISGVKRGLQNFVGNIGKHLKKGLMSWLFGALAEAGIKLPESFDLKGILSLVMQVLGLTWENLRARAVKLFLAKELLPGWKKQF